MKSRVLLGIAALFIAGVTSAQMDAIRIANNLKLRGVSRIEMIETNKAHYAVMDVEFVNSGEQSVKFHDGTINIVFDIQGGLTEEIEPSYTEKIEAKMKKGEEISEFEAKTYRRVLRRAKMVQLGVINLGDKAVPGDMPLRVANTQEKVNSALELTAPDEGEKVNSMNRRLYVRIGKAGDNIAPRILDIANILGDPAITPIVRLKIHSQTALGFGGNWLDDGVMRTIELNLEPAIERKWLFK